LSAKRADALLEPAHADEQIRLSSTRKREPSTQWEVQTGAACAHLLADLERARMSGIGGGAPLRPRVQLVLATGLLRPIEVGVHRGQQRSPSSSELSRYSRTPAAGLVNARIIAFPIALAYSNRGYARPRCVRNGQRLTRSERRRLQKADEYVAERRRSLSYRQSFCD
jgi:hypothetical protein